MDGIYTMASPSSSSLYGNVGCAIRELILSKFPYNYFQYMNVSTEVAFKNLRRQFGSNTNNEISKRKYPQLIIQPSYQVPDADGFLQSIPLTKNDMDIQHYTDRRYLFEVIKDNQYDWSLKFKLNRDRIDYDVTVVVQTLHQQLDVYKAMINQMTWDRSFYYPAALEAVLPKTMVTYMSRLCNMDIDTYPEFIPMFLRHLNSVAGYPITYKVKNASATDEFFMYYQHNLVVTYTDLQLESANKKGMLDESYNITFRVTVDFNLPGLFILDGAESNMAKLKVLLVDKTSLGKGYDQDKDDFIPLFSLSNFYNKFPQRREGLTLYGSFLFTSEEKSHSDTADIGLLIEPEHQKAIRFHTKYGMLDKTICRVYIMKNSEELAEDQFTVNWDTFKIEYKNPDPSATYRVAIYMNMEVLNADLSNPRIDEPYDQHALRENHIDYSNTKNQTVIDLDDPKSTDTDFTADAKGFFEDKEIPGFFRAEGIDYDRVDKSKKGTMVATPTSRNHEDAWHNMATVPKYNEFVGDMKLTPSDHRDENSFHNMAQEVKNNSIYPDIELTPSDHRDEDSFHRMAQETKDIDIYKDMNVINSNNDKGFSSDNVTIETKSDGTIQASGIVNLSNLIGPLVPNKKTKEEVIEEIADKEPVKEKKEVIMKYYSSIFDDSTKVKADKKDTPTKKYKWSSSIEDQEEEEKYHFSDSLDPIHIDAINTWSKIVSNAMLYNYATKIAIEDSNNYNMDINPGPKTTHMCTCGCEDPSKCTCGFKDRL